MRIQFTGTTTALCLIGVFDLTCPRAATAQEASQLAQAQRPLEQITVEGRKPYTDADVDIVRKPDDPQPYYFLDENMIQQSGATTVEDLLKQTLTMNTVARTNFQSNPGSAGVMSAINLRGAGVNSTIILINGRRTLGSGSFGTNNQFDVNGIPVGAIERIEVLPSSASAVYGGSAIGGVVNIVLKRDLNGGDVQVRYGSPMDTIASTRSVDAQYGFSLEDDRTHIMLGASYSAMDALTNADRPDLLQRGINTILANRPQTYLTSSLPSNLGNTTSIGAANGSNLVLKPAYGGTALGSPITYVPFGTLATTPAAALGAGLAANAGSLDLSLPDSAARLGTGGQLGGAPERKAFLASVHRSMTSWLELFTDYEYFETSSSTPSIFGTTYQVPAAASTNPFQQNVNVFLPNIDPYNFVSGAQNRRWVTGMVVSLPHEWRAEADYTYSYAASSYSTAFYQSALATDIAAGVVNPFVDTSTSALNLHKYQGQYFTSSPSTLNDYAVRASGPLLPLPGGPLMLSTGLEHRKEGLDDQYYTELAPLSPLQNYTVIYYGHSQTVKSAYAEANIPLVGPAMHWPGVNLLEAQLAVRREDFSVSTGTQSNYVTADPSLLATNHPVTDVDVRNSATRATYAVRYQPIQDVTLRSSYSGAFLPPSYLNLVPGLLNNGYPTSTLSVIDSRRGNQVVANVPFIAGGNADLKPQSATSLDAGIILEPRAVPGLRVDLEWYRLRQSNLIISPTAQQVVDAEALYPGRVTRGPVAAGDPYGVGPITQVNYSLYNAAKGLTQGYDLTASYQLKTERYGAFSATLQGTYVDLYKVQSVNNGPFLNTTNEIYANAPLKFRAFALLGWRRGPWGVNWNVNYYTSYPQNPAGGVLIVEQGSDHIPSQTYHDVMASYSVETQERAGRGWYDQALDGVTVQFRVNNVFNHVPPLDVAQTSSFLYSPFGDARLRNFEILLRKEF